jgi:hypothetical protein
MTATLRITLTLSVLSLVALPLAGAEKADDGPVRFERRQLLLSPNEGCALADVDRDGQTDIIAGTHWFAAPDFAPRPIRTIREFDDDFLANNGDHPYDVNGDGWIDVISGEWMEDEIHWYENPGKERLEKGLRWKPHLFKKTRGENEAMFLRDLDGDGVPEIIVDCWVSDAPLVCWKLVRDDAGEPAIERVVLGPSGCGHGMALGDVNGDGRDDIVSSHEQSTGGLLIWAHRSTAGAFASPAVWSDLKTGGWSFDQSLQLAADIDADGDGDLYTAHRSSTGQYNIWTHTSTRTAFQAPSLYRNVLSGYNYDGAQFATSRH